MLGDADRAKLRGVIIIADCVTDIVEEGEDNFELRPVSRGDNADDDDNALEIPPGSFIATLILSNVSFKDEDEEAASDDKAIASNQSISSYVT
jgi:hypothetical protein